MPPIEHIAITECPTGVGATFHGLSRGPDALISAGITGKLEALGTYTVSSSRPFEPIEGTFGAPKDKTEIKDEALAVDVNRKIKRQILTNLAGGKGGEPASPPLQLILGGVCTMCPAIVSAFMETLEPHRQIGIIWFDADADLSLPNETPDSTNIIAFMAFSQMTMRQGALQSMKEFSAPRHDTTDIVTGVSNPGNTVLFGLNTTHQAVIPREHLTYLMDNHYRVYSATAIRQSVEAARLCAKQALNYLTANGCDTFVVHVDVDAIDAKEFPLGNVPSFTGISFEQFMAALNVLITDRRVLGLNLTEMNPDRDTGLIMTRQLVDGVVESFKRRAEGS